MKATIDISIPSAPKYLTLIRDLNRHIAKEAGFTEEDAMKITLAIDEAGTNIIRHSYDGKQDEVIEIAYWLLQDQLKIRMIDYGTALDPATIKMSKWEGSEGEGILVVPKAGEMLYRVA